MKQFIGKHKRKLIVFAVLAVVLIWAFVPNRATRLINAIEDENVELVREYLESGVDPNKTDIPISKWWHIVEHSATRPLSVACDTGNLQIVQLLIDYGATAEPIEDTGWSPLRETLFYYYPNDVEIVVLLLKHGADPGYEESGDLPVYAAARMRPRRYDPERKNGTVFEDGYDEETARGITEIVKLLLGDGSVNEQYSLERTLLMCAAEKGNVYLVEYLLSQGADRTLTDWSGQTAYDYAVENGHSDLLELLNPYA